MRDISGRKFLFKRFGRSEDGEMTHAWNFEGCKYADAAFSSFYSLLRLWILERIDAVDGGLCRVLSETCERSELLDGLYWDEGWHKWHE